MEIHPLPESYFEPLEYLFADAEDYAVNFDCLGTTMIMDTSYLVYQHKITRKEIYISQFWQDTPADCLLLLALQAPDDEPLFGIATHTRARLYAEGAWNLTGIVF